MNRNDFFSIEVSIFPDVSELQAMHKVISIQKKIVTTFSRGRWRPVKCNICKYILPATRNYLMEQHITRRHEGKPLTWTVPKRDSFRNPGAYQPEFFLIQTKENRLQEVPSQVSQTTSCSLESYRFTFIPCWKDFWRPIYANQ